MVKAIVKDPLLLSQKALPAGKDDLAAAKDLLDTLYANREHCVGMAANMIGVLRRIIAFDDGGKIFVMLNPEIISRKGEYEAEEGCLSLSGTRTTKRFREIRVRFSDLSFSEKEKSYDGFTAEIIQHEIDHTNGILI